MASIYHIRMALEDSDRLEAVRALVKFRKTCMFVLRGSFSPRQKWLARTDLGKAYDLIAPFSLKETEEAQSAMRALLK